MVAIAVSALIYMQNQEGILMVIIQMRLFAYKKRE